MIRDDILWALNLTLLPISSLAAFYSLRFQRFMAKKGYDGQPTGMLTLVRATSVLTCGSFIYSALWMIWDLGLMGLSEARDMGIVIRSMAILGAFLVCEFHHATMESSGRSLKDWFPAAVMVYLIMVYTVMVLI